MAKARIAVISANEAQCRFFELELRMLGLDVDVYGQLVSRIDDYDMIIVDTDTVRELRGMYSCPIITVSSSSDEDSGAWPWPTPIDTIRDTVTELLYPRFSTATGRPVTDDSTAVVYVTDRESGAVVVDNCHVKLSASELLLLEMLCSARGKTVPRAKIMSGLGARSGNISDVYICHLRKKLETPLGRRLIFTERNKGYRTVLVMAKK